MGKDKTLTNAYYNEFIDVVYIPALKDYFNNKLSIEAISEKYKNKISHIAHRANQESIRVRTFFAKSEGNLELSFNVINSINHYSEQANIIRKGATSANKDELLIIPLNMRDGSLICIGKGNEITAQEGTNIINLISPNKPIATTNFIRLYGKYLIDTGDVVVQDKKKSRKIYKFK